MNKQFNNIIKLILFLFFYNVLFVNNNFAGVFLQNNIGIYYIKDNNQLAKNEWIVANDGTGDKQYYFNEFGYFTQVKNIEPVVINNNMPISNGNIIPQINTNNNQMPNMPNTPISNNNQKNNNQYKMNPIEYSEYLKGKRHKNLFLHSDLDDYYYDYLNHSFHSKLTNEIIYDTDLADYLNSCIDEYIEENKEQLMDDYFSDYIKESLYLHPYDEYCDCYYCLSRRYWYK